MSRWVEFLKREVPERVKEEIDKMNACSHVKWNEKEIEFVYGYKDCCECDSCGMHCGERLNAPYSNFKVDLKQVWNNSK